jgi:hypothetical protein
MDDYFQKNIAGNLNLLILKSSKNLFFRKPFIGSIFMARFCTFLCVVSLATSISLFSQTSETPSGWSDGEGGKIENLNQLYWLSQTVDAWDEDWLLVSDIDASASSAWDTGLGWTPIGNGTSPFSGTFDGGNHQITGIYCSRTATDRIGFFGNINGAAIKRIHLRNCSISGKGMVGGLVGESLSGSVISESSTTGTVVSASAAAGGIVGQFDEGSILNLSYSECSVSSNTSYAIGGLVGYSDEGSTVSNCYATGSVHGVMYVGGLVGMNYTDAVIVNCFSTGSVTGNSDLGGLTGLQRPTATTTESFWDTQTSLQGSSASGTGKITSLMKTKSTFSAWDFAGSSGDGTDDYWGYTADNYPYLRTVSLSSFTPSNMATGVSTSPTIQIEFSENIEIVAGNESGIVLKKVSDESTVFTASGPTLSVGTGDDADLLTVDISGITLSGDTEYCLVMSGNVIRATADEKYFSGIVLNEYSFTTAAPYSEIDISYSGNAVELNTTLNLGSVTTPTPQEFTFTTANSGNGELALTGETPVTLSGANADKFEISAQPASPISAGSSTTFVLKYTPGLNGTDEAIITVLNSETVGTDATDETTYSFNITITSDYKTTNFSTTDDDLDGKKEVTLSYPLSTNDTKTVSEIGFQIAEDYAMTTNMIYIPDPDAQTRGSIQLNWDDYSYTNVYYCRWYVKYTDDSYDYGDISSFIKNEGDGVIRIGDE